MTGAATGIGRATASRLAAEGASVVVNYIGDPAPADSLVSDVEGAGGRAVAIAADVSNEEQVTAMFGQAREELGGPVDLLAPYLYIHMGRPDRTDDVVRDILAKHYSLARDGLPGNDDGGTLSAWYVWSAMGLFPNAGQPYYYIGSPLFSRTRIALPGRRIFTIEAPATSDANRYVIAATLNGKPLQRAWLTHAEVARGGVLHLDMGPSPSGWGRADRPYSLPR